MNRVIKRSLSVILLVLFVILGIGFYVVRYAVYGGTWATAPFNPTVYSGGVLTVGKIVDRNEVVLADISEGRRVFASSSDVRRATLHAVGDREGNIGTGALRVLAPRLSGYNPLTGAYKLGDSGDDAGGAITLTIDSQLNVEARKALDGRRGAVLVSNYKTGEILCMVSNPAFDPADPPASVDEESGIYLNRAIQSAYTPGSVFKLITAGAAIQEIGDIHERIFICEGQFEASDDIVTCSGVHGELDFERGLQVSCNVVFGQLAIELGANTLSKYAVRYGVAGSGSIEGIKTAVGNFEKAGSDTADLAWSGVGQYMNTVCPASMLRFVSAIAHEGKAVDLHYAQKSGLSSIQPVGSSRLMPRDAADDLAEIMAVQNNDNFPGLQIYAKSGTAQVGSGKEPHAWYVGFITNPEHPYAFVVIVENGGGGTAVAAPVANKVLQAAINHLS